MGYILHIDTSTDSATYFLAYNGAVISSVTSHQAKDHATNVNDAIASLLAEARVSWTDVSAVAVCGGPGSYTGLRIGLATAKGYCYALGIPLLMNNKLNLLALQQQSMYQQQFEYYIVLMFAREKEYYGTLVDNIGSTIVEPKHFLDEEAQRLLQTWNSHQLIADRQLTLMDSYYKNDNVAIISQVASDNWALVAFEGYKCKNFVNLSTSEPFYLKQVYTHNPLTVK